MGADSDPEIGWDRNKEGSEVSGYLTSTRVRKIFDERKKNRVDLLEPFP